MNGFEVSPPQLKQVGGRLVSIGDTVGKAHKGLEGIGREHTGDAKLAHAIEDFHKKWEYSLKKIGENAKKMGEGVGMSAEDYGGTDQEIFNAMPDVDGGTQQA